MQNKVPSTPARRSIQATVRDGYAGFSPVERRLADLILNFPGELPGYSASELAVMAETSNAAVSRFVRRLGFRNYEEMRRLAREEREAGAPLYLFERAEPPAGAAVLERHVETVVGNIGRTFAGIDAGAFSGFAAAVAAAPQVWVVGFRHCHYIAGYIRWSLAHARPQVRLLPAAGETLGESLVDLGRGDVVLMLAMRRRVPAVKRLLAQAAGAGGRVALLTDAGMVETAGAEWVFRAEALTRGPIDDHASLVVFGHALTEQVMADLAAAAKARLGRIDDLHAEIGEL